MALQLAQFTGAPPALAATLAVLSGLVGALILPGFLTLIGVRHPLARGLAIGAVSHGVGTARAREEGGHRGGQFDWHGTGGLAGDAGGGGRGPGLEAEG